MQKIPKFLLLLPLGVVCFTASLKAQVTNVPTSYEGVAIHQPYPSFSGGTNYFPGYAYVGYQIEISEVDYFTLYTLDLTSFDPTTTLVDSVNFSWTNAGSPNGGSYTFFLTATESNNITNNIGSSPLITTNGLGGTYNTSLTGTTNLTALVQDNLGGSLSLYGYANGTGTVQGGTPQFSLNLSPAPEPSAYALLGISTLGMMIAFRFRKQKMDF